MLALGIAFVLMGVLSEVVGGSFFRQFFSWRSYPPKWPNGLRGNGERIKLLAFRITLVVGVAMVVVDLITRMI